MNAEHRGIEREGGKKKKKKEIIPSKYSNKTHFPLPSVGCWLVKCLEGRSRMLGAVGLAVPQRGLGLPSIGLSDLGPVEACWKGGEMKGREGRWWKKKKKRTEGPRLAPATA